KVTHFVASAGTGGTVSGIGRYLKDRNPAIRVFAGDPIGSLYAWYHRTHLLADNGAPYKVEGIGGDKVPTTLWWDVIDEFRTVSDRDAMAMARRLAREEGILAGGSTGVNLVVALEIARELDDPDACVVTILADTGERYLSKVFNDAWLQENQLLDAPRPTVLDLLRRRGDDAKEVVQVAPAAQVRQALNLMSTFDVSQIPVIEDKDCVGSLVESALMTAALEDPSVLDRAVRDVMDKPFPSVESSLTIDRLAPMLTRGSPAALVVEHGDVIGIVSRYDVLQLMIGR
ncbi:MAG: pyridoxal-phosphate dependent enzyme, partial [Gemmatimonadales bacterium]